MCALGTQELIVAAYTLELTSESKYSIFSLSDTHCHATKTTASLSYFDEKFEKFEEKLATKECIQQLHDVIKGQSQRIEILESKVVVMENYIA